MQIDRPFIRLPIQALQKKAAVGGALLDDLAGGRTEESIQRRGM